MSGLVNATLLALPNWSEIPERNGQTVFIHPYLTGCMIYDHLSDVVVFFDEVDPSESAILDAIKRYRGHRREVPLQQRLLEAERWMLYPPRVIDNRFDSPFEVFPLLEQAYAVVENISQGGDSVVRSHWLVFPDPDSWRRYQEVQERLQQAVAAGDTIEQLKAENNLLFLTGSAVGRWFTVYLMLGSFSGWQEALTCEVDTTADVDDYMGLVYTSCRDCKFTTPVMFWSNDRGDYLRKLYYSWRKHNETHPDCQGKPYVY